MNLNELDNTSVVEAQLIWARKGNNLTRKYRCVVGKRAGRIVSKPGQCSAPIDIKKRLVLKKTKIHKIGARSCRFYVFLFCFSSSIKIIVSNVFLFFKFSSFLSLIITTSVVTIAIT